MPRVTPLPPGPELAQRLRALWRGWMRLLPPLDPRGVRRYRNLEEAARDHEAAAIRRARRLAAERAAGDAVSDPR